MNTYLIWCLDLDTGAYVYVDNIKVYLGTKNLLYSNTSRSDVVKHLKTQILQNSISLAYPHCLGLGPITGPGLVMKLHICACSLYTCTCIFSVNPIFPVYDAYTYVVRALHTDHERIKYKRESKLLLFKIIITMYLQQSLKLVIAINHPN